MFYLLIFSTWFSSYEFFSVESNFYHHCFSGQDKRLMLPAASAARKWCTALCSICFFRQPHPHHCAPSSLTGTPSTTSGDWCSCVWLDGLCQFDPHPTSPHSSSRPIRGNSQLTGLDCCLLSLLPYPEEIGIVSEKPVLFFLYCLQPTACKLLEIRIYVGMPFIIRKQNTLSDFCAVTLPVWCWFYSSQLSPLGWVGWSSREAILITKLLHVNYFHLLPHHDCIHMYFSIPVMSLILDLAVFGVWESWMFIPLCTW